MLDKPTKTNRLRIANRGIVTGSQIDLEPSQDSREAKNFPSSIYLSTKGRTLDPIVLLAIPADLGRKRSSMGRVCGGQLAEYSLGRTSRDL